MITSEEAVEHGEQDTLSKELKELLDPSRSAVLVIDKQRSYCDPSETLLRLIDSDSDELQAMLPRLDKFISETRKIGVPVIWTRMIEDPNLSEPSVRKKMQIEDCPPLSTPGTPGFEYMGAGPLEGEKEIIKGSYDAFTGTDLDEFLKDKGVKTLVLTGAYTSRCVHSTAVRGFGLGYNVVIATDLVGVPRKMKEEEKAIIGQVKAIFGFTLPSSQVSRVWNEDRESRNPVSA